MGNIHLNNILDHGCGPADPPIGQHYHSYLKITLKDAPRGSFAMAWQRIFVHVNGFYDNEFLCQMFDHCATLTCSAFEIGQGFF